MADNVFEKSKASALSSYDLKKMDEMYAYYANKGCEVKELKEYMDNR